MSEEAGPGILGAGLIRCLREYIEPALVTAAQRTLLPRTIRKNQEDRIPCEDNAWYACDSALALAEIENKAESAYCGTGRFEQSAGRKLEPPRVETE